MTRKTATKVTWHRDDLGAYDATLNGRRYTIQREDERYHQSVPGLPWELTWTALRPAGGVGWGYIGSYRTMRQAKAAAIADAER